MRSPNAITQYVCVSCLLRQSRRPISTATTTASSLDNEILSSNSKGSETASILQIRRIPQNQTPRRRNGSPNPHQVIVRRTFSSSNALCKSVELSTKQQGALATIFKVRNRLLMEVGMKPGAGQLAIEDAVKKLQLTTENDGLADQKRVADNVALVLAGRKLADVVKVIDQVSSYRLPTKRKVEDEGHIKILDRLGLLSISETSSKAPTSSKKQDTSASTEKTPKPNNPVSVKSEEKSSHHNKGGRKPRKRGVLSRNSKDIRKVRSTKVRKVESTSSSPPSLPKKPQETSPAKIEHDDEVAVFDEKDMHAISARDLWLKPLPIGTPDVPKLSFDLSRVLFNPGVYQLQDPRSRVFNFDPYLANIMPVSEFNYDALNEYITSSEDDLLRDVAKQYRKRYIGSSSSMSGTLSHFHFLLSGWRELGLSNLSRTFPADSKQVTKLHRGPTAIFLKYKDGVYAVDADKEYDSANILMSLGKSMEKLLTLEKDEFERYRKSTDPAKQEQLKDMQPEQYHYGEIGDFLMRSQLDAYDPRLPGTGMFDLKTRAVAAVRMNMSNYEVGMNYQIKHRLGNWESYEREYYDMMRSAFLKYSLQVRMGRMDGIFVAYHNVQRIFGFQYVSLPELDTTLHGQSDRTLGDQEFCISVKLLNEIFDRATTAFPEQNIRFHFETREKTGKRESVPYMYIFAEPISETDAQRIQNSKKEEVAAFEKRIFNPNLQLDSEGETEAIEEKEIKAAETKQADGSELQNEQEAVSIEQTTPAPSSNAANVDFLDSLSNIRLDVPSNPVLGFKLIIRNRVNGQYTPRPQNLTIEDDWDVEYTLTQMADAKTKSKYIQCKNRRATVLSFTQDEDRTASAYIRNLMKMSEKGGEWRRQMDEADAMNETVVLYPEKCIVNE